MKTRDQILAAIIETTKQYAHVLTLYPATFDVNAPRAALQLQATTRLDALYWMIGESRPQFRCDDARHVNH